MIHLILWLLVFALATPAHAAETVPESAKINVIDDPGRFQVGHDPAWADPAFDDSGWEPAVMGRFWRTWSPATSEDPRGWYRVRVTVPRDRPISLLNKHIHAAAEVFVNGQLVHTVGDIERGTNDVHRPLSFEVPRELTRTGELVIATRVVYDTRPPGNGFMEAWAHAHPEGALSFLARDIHARWLLPQGLSQALVAAGLVGLGLLHGLLWLRRREPEQGFFALGATLLGLTIGFGSLVVMGEASSSAWLGRTQFAQRYIPYLCLLWFAYEFMGSRARRAMWVISAAVLVASVISTFRVPYPWSTMTVAPTTALLAVAGIAVLVDGVRRRVPYARVLVAGFLPLTLIGLIDVATGLGLTASLGAMAKTVYDIRNWGLNLSFASILGTMSFALISRFADTLEELERTWKATARFVPDQFLALLGHQRITEVRRGDSTSRDITVMFCAIPKFSTMSEEWTAEQSFAFLNRFLAAMEPHIHENGGFVAQYLGDGFLAMFPVGSSRPVDAAVALQQAALALEPEPGQARVKVAIGLHTGPVMLGTVGSEERLTTGQVSDVVNTSSRVKGLTAHYGAPIVISEATRALVEDDGWALQELDAVVMKGKAEAILAFEVLSGEPDPVLRRFKESEAAVYDEGLAAFRAGELERARPIFARLADRWVAARLFVQRCDWFLANGLPADWDGVVRLTVK